ncbi:MAG: hypothetical protein CFE45_13020 [Burkholderiales bacterium PBB5]|nr:MAG: hypothetical protein CFE45_13020 [Burkholderiales bacterium PBB5]
MAVPARLGEPWPMLVLQMTSVGCVADAARLVERQRLLDEAERQMALGQVAPAPAAGAAPPHRTHHHAGPEAA